jgi:hypothetical protein
VQVIAHLGEVEARRLHLELGFRSLFEYCTEHLRYSENEAGIRILAARTARRFPIIYQALLEGSLHVTAVCRLARFLTEENQAELLTTARNKSKAEVDALLATLFPAAFEASRKAHGNDVIQPCGANSYRVQFAATEELRAKLEFACDMMSHSNPKRELSVVIERALDALIKQLITRRFGKSLQQSRAGAGLGVAGAPEQPIRDAGAILQTCAVVTASPSACHGHPPVEATREEPRTKGSNAASRALEQKRIACDSEMGTTSGLTAPAPPPPSLRSHDTPGTQQPRLRMSIPSAVRRAILERDGLRCTFTSAAGRRCSARAQLQFHHQHAWARGGPDTTENLSVMCAAHNRYLAEQDFGIERIKRFIESAKIAQTPEHAIFHPDCRSGVSQALDSRGDPVSLL